MCALSPSPFIPWFLAARNAAGGGLWEEGGADLAGRDEHRDRLIIYRNQNMKAAKAVALVKANGSGLCVHMDAHTAKIRSQIQGKPENVAKEASPELPILVLCSDAHTSQAKHRDVVGRKAAPKQALLKHPGGHGHKGNGAAFGNYPGCADVMPKLVLARVLSEEAVYIRLTAGKGSSIIGLQKKTRIKAHASARPEREEAGAGFHPHPESMPSLPRKPGPEAGDRQDLVVQGGERQRQPWEISSSNFPSLPQKSRSFHAEPRCL